MKPKIHFHTDCDFFAGCENMLSVLFNSERFRQAFDVSLSYGYSSEYEKGLSERIRTDNRKYPLKTVIRYRGRKSGAYLFFLKAMNNVFKYAFFARNTYAIYRVIKKEDPDIIHINNGGYPGAYSCSSAVYAARLAGKDRIVYVVNNIAAGRSTMLRMLDFWIDRFVSKNVSVFITGSEYAGKKLQEVLLFDEKKRVRIPNTIFPRAPDETPAETRKRLDISAGAVLIGCVGILEERKGQRYLIEAFGELIKETGRTHEIKLVLEGTGSQKEALVRLAGESNLAGNVVFTEEKNIYNLYSCLDVFVLPSVSNEDFPNVIIEAMSLGKPVIGTRLAGIPEQIADGKNGYITEPRDVTGMKEAMKKLATDARRREDMGSESRNIYKENYSGDIVLGRYINLYDSLLIKNHVEGQTK